MENPKFEIFPGKNGEYYFRLRARNGEPILASEGYKAKSGAMNGIESVRENAGQDDRFKRKTSSNGKPYFVLVAGNNEPIGKSEMYSSEAAMENGIAAVKEVAPNAPVDDSATD